MFDSFLVLTLFSLLGFATLLIAISRNLFVATLLASIASLLVALVFSTLNAPDVALTEAAVSAGVSTLFFLAVLTETGNFHSYQKKNALPGFLAATVFAALIVYSTIGLPPHGDATAIAHTHLAEYFLTHTLNDTGVANAVTAVLASYRGFDTLGELLVIFTAGIATLGMASLRNKQTKT